MKSLADYFLIAFHPILFNQQVKAAKKPAVKETKLTLKVGQSKTLTMQNCKGLKLTFKSDDKSIATVSSKGKIKAKKAGKTTIRITAEKNKLTCKLTVKDNVITSDNKAVSLSTTADKVIVDNKTGCDIELIIEISSQDGKKIIKEVTSENIFTLL